MIDFAIIALPRSGTAWSSVWLACKHDPLATMSFEELSEHEGGVSCTALWLYPEFIYENIKRWVIIDGNIGHIQDWCVSNGYPAFTGCNLELFNSLRGTRVNINDLFDTEKARDIWEYLKPDFPFNQERHEQLKLMNITTSCSYV